MPIANFVIDGTGNGFYENNLCHNLNDGKDATLSSLGAPGVIVMTTAGDPGDYKVGTMMTIGFQWPMTVDILKFQRGWCRMLKATPW